MDLMFWKQFSRNETTAHANESGPRYITHQLMVVMTKILRSASWSWSRYQQTISICWLIFIFYRYCILTKSTAHSCMMQEKFIHSFNGVFAVRFSGFTFHIIWCVWDLLLSLSWSRHRFSEFPIACTIDIVCSTHLFHIPGREKKYFTWATWYDCRDRTMNRW